MRSRGKFSALLGLILEEIGCFEHCDPPQQKPRSPGLRPNKNAGTGYLFQKVQTTLRPLKRPPYLRVPNDEMLPAIAEVRTFNCPAKLPEGAAFTFD
jgi:hypothetical protein